MKRNNNREMDQLRSISVSYNIFPYAAGSVLWQQDATQILCAVNIQNTVPQFLRGKNNGGWLTAEYALLPASTHYRTTRELSSHKRNGRSVEISRLISRVLRMAVNTQVLGERTIIVDCDVLQADGGTRTASINAALCALKQAQNTWLADGTLPEPFLTRELAALSIGIINDTPILDPDYQEDSTGTADLNIIVTRENKLIELQGGAEKAPLSWEQFDTIKQLAQSGAKQIFETITHAEKSLDECMIPAHTKRKKTPLFSLQNR